MTIQELMEKRAKVWEAAKNFVDTHENENGVLSAEDSAAYERMEAEIEDLTKAIDRHRKAKEMEKNLNQPVNQPLTGKLTNRKTWELAGKSRPASSAFEVMQLVVTVKEMKNYLRVDFDDDDVLLSDLIEQGQQICMDVARITDEDEFEDLQGTKIAVQYAAAYLYEHREEADHHQLVMDLRSLLFGVRKPGF